MSVRTLRALAALACVALTACGAEPELLVSARDATPPRVVAVSPSDSTVSVPVSTVLTAQFSEVVNASTVNGSSFTLTSANGESVSSVVTLNGDMAVFSPTGDLAGNTRYTAVISRDIKDVAGNPIAAGYTWNFITASAPDVVAPTVTATTPLAGATGVPLNGVVTATFSEPVAPGTVSASSVRVTTSGGAAIAGTISLAGNTVSFAPVGNLTPSTTFLVTVTTAVKDIAGNSLASNFVWTFATGAAADVTPPIITANTPSNGAVNVAVGVAPAVTFSEAMSGSTITNATFTLASAAGTAVPGSVALAGNTATFTPSTALAGNTAYTATVSSAVTDASGNAMAAPASWTFTTGVGQDVTPPIIVGNTPANGATGVAIAVAPVVTFSEPMQNASLNSSSFVLSAAGGTSVPASVTIAGNSATLTPNASLAYNTQYTATVTTAARDAAGNALVSNAFWSFTTAPAPDVTAPTVVSRTPASAATNVAVSIAPAVTFSEPMRANTISTTSFQLRPTAGGAAVSGSVALAGNTATFTPAAVLTQNTQYTATITNAAMDLAGNPLAGNVTWNFTTDPGPVTSLVLSPGTASVETGATQQFSATGRRAADPNTVVPVTVSWSATGGSISSSGLFTAGSTAGSTFRVTATLSSNSAVSAQVSGTVTAPGPIPTGSWINVTPGNVNLTSDLSCGNFGTENVGVDPNQPSHFYTSFHCQGIWKSVDYGRTWTGPINTGTNGSTVTDCAGGVRVAPNGAGNPPIIYLACYRGAGTGFWRSLDGGVNWTRYNIAPAAGNRQDVYPPSVDPYDANHLIMAGHEQDLLVESVNGGQTWTTVPVNNGMRVGNGTASISFIKTGSASGTRGTWIWMAQQSGGVYGTWRTTNSGASWVQVDRNEHPHGFAEVYQPDANGTVYMAGAYSVRGWGVLRSTDYGVTWSHVGMTANQRVVYSTPRAVYSMYSYPTGLGATNGPSFQVAAQPGTGAWSQPATPSAMRQGGSQVAVSTDGSRYYIVSAAYGAGLWLYVEP